MIYQQRYGWAGEKTTAIVNLREDPFERTPLTHGETLNDSGGGNVNDFYVREFWRFALVQQPVAALAETAAHYPPYTGADLAQSRSDHTRDSANDQSP